MGPHPVAPEAMQETAGWRRSPASSEKTGAELARRRHPHVNSGITAGGLRGIISTDASAQTTATSTIKDEANLSSLSARSSTISSAPRKVATSEGARKAAAAPFETGEHTIPALGVQRPREAF
jgi:hypothetical protein